MNTPINIMRTATALILAIALLAPSVAADELPQSPYPTVNRALLEMIKRTDSITPILVGMHLPSEATAEFWSMTGTFLPIVTAVAIWKRQKPKHIREYDSEGRLFRDYHLQPDRTVPYAIMAAGVMLGPSIGYLYGGCSSLGFRGILTRTVTGAATVGVAYAVGKSVKGEGWMDFSGVAAASFVGTIGAGIIIIHSAYDLGKVRQAVKEQNEKRVKAYLSLKPETFGPDYAPGLRLTLTF